MTSSLISPRRAPGARLLPFAALLLAAPLVQAQYKVVDNDGKVTYSDRAPSSSEGRVTALGARAPLEPAEPDLPFELRQAATKYPVTLYTTTGGCDPCNAGRQLLKQRGIPFTERQAITGEDVDALERITGGRDAPTLTVGAQVLRGYASDPWTQTLDAAGYPRDSRLPSTYQHRPVAPVVERRDPAVARGSETAAPVRQLPIAQPPVGTTTSGSPGGIRF
jgi:glutaredoxin